jgi:hypothetical protein
MTKCWKPTKLNFLKIMQKILDNGHELVYNNRNNKNKMKGRY